MKTKTLKLGSLSRVEGEGAVTLTIRGEELTDVKLHIFEPPRFFEAFLRGRRYDEAPDITSRICGICPIAYQISSVTAMERAFGVTVGGQLRALRRLIYFGEWIESHALHIHLLHAPDFLGYPDAIRMAVDHPEIVKRGLRLKKLGNDLMSAIGGREVHPVSIRVGGFHAVPSRGDLAGLRERLKPALDDAVEAARWTSTLPIPDFEPKTVFVAMKHPSEYPVFEGEIASSDGHELPIEEFETQYCEYQEKHSHALHSRSIGTGCYQVGPLARFNLNRGRLSATARSLANELGLPAMATNPFQSIVVRAIETVHAIEEAAQIIDRYEPPESPSIPFQVHAGEGAGCSEAPRGICYHRYRIDDAGAISFARIVPPTAQNLARVEQDLREWVPRLMSLPSEQLRVRCEQAVRNYDPCISCATHFVKLEISPA